MAGTTAFIAQSENYEVSPDGDSTTLIPAEILEVSENGELLRAHVAVGNPGSPAHVDGGWLFPETNSYWGSHQAGLEWLDPSSGTLRTLTEVPVRSSVDGMDGAYAVATLGETVYVANCESGLLGASWSTESLTLGEIGDFAPGAIGSCSAQDVVGAGSILMLTTASELVFARPCSGD